MKKNRVLFGLIAGLITLAGGTASAQNGGGKFYEVGPSNISGKVTCLAKGPQDVDKTVYAGSASGGLFVRTSNTSVLRALYAGDLSMEQSRKEILWNDTNSWHLVRYVRPGDGREVSLPISCMVAGSDGALYMGTGFSRASQGKVRSGCGVFRYDPADGSFTMLAETDDDRFWAVNALDYIYRNDTMYLYVATANGLFRWAVADSDVASGAWGYQLGAAVISGQEVTDVKIVRPYRTAYVSTTVGTTGARLFKVGDVTRPDATLQASVVDITASNSGFDGMTGIKLAVAPSDPNYLYAMTINYYGMMDNVYLTSNGQTWVELATTSVFPFTYTDGMTGGALSVDPKNPKRLIVGGTDIWIGEGFVPNSYYQWTAASSNEYVLMAQRPVTGDYMSRVFNNASYVHSGINDFLYLPFYYEDTLYYNYYIATDGGVFSSNEFFGSYVNVNRGLNTVSVNGLSVSPDGTVVIGSVGNACPVIEPHLAHFGGQPMISWFDDGTMGNFSHDANVIWRAGHGGAVAASAFQQYAPQTRRTIFTSAAGGMLGRTYADYLDYTNTNTWTSGTGFMTEELYAGPSIPQIYLWETDTNTVFNSVVKGAVDTLGYVFRMNDSTGAWDTVWVNAASNGANRGSKFDVLPGDKVVFHSRGHADYPFEYIYEEAKKSIDTVTVRNPLQSRMVTVADRAPSGLETESVTTAVWYSWMPTDFTKVFDAADYNSGLQGNAQLLERQHLWAPILTIRRAPGSEMENVRPRNAVISNTGRQVYVSASDYVNQRSMLFRVSGFEKADYTANMRSLLDALSVDKDICVLTIDTFKYNGDKWFPRVISSIAVDPRAGEDRLILTFEGYDYASAFPNVMVVENAADSLTNISPVPLESMPQIPAYCALVEDSTGAYYVGTEKGVYTKSGSGAWTLYEDIPEVPVTAMYQQTKKLPIRRNLTHTGINPNNYVFAKTKWPRAIYFGTYGRGVFMDMSYVTDTVNEIVDSVDYTPVGIPTVNGVGLNGVSLYPNPVTTEATVAVTSAVAGVAVVRVYDLNGRCVIDRQLGFAAEGENHYTLQTQGLGKGMYLVNVIIGGHTAATKMMVR